MQKFETQCKPQTSCINLDLLQNYDYKLCSGLQLYLNITRQVYRFNRKHNSGSAGNQFRIAFTYNSSCKHYIHTVHSLTLFLTNAHLFLHVHVSVLLS